MANWYNTQPIILDTDTATGWRALQTLTTNQFGIRVTKITLVANGTGGSAGVVSILDPLTSQVLYPPLYVAAAQAAAGIVLYFDDCVPALTWRDFMVSGLTATQSTLYIWYRA